MNGNRTQTVLEGAAAALDKLKDFQRQTVDHVCEELFRPGGSGRFLVADEVGLGKTLVAKGVVARTIERLRDEVERLDIIYVCSNADIARQNISRLKIEGEKHVELASRLTLLPKYAEQLDASPSRLNFVSFTPATSFELSGGLGHQDERALLFSLLKGPWDFGQSVAPLNVLQGHAGIGFRERAEQLRPEDFDPAGKSRARFIEVLNRRAELARAGGEEDLRTRFEALCRAMPRANSRVDEGLSRERSRVVGELRAALATSCIAALEPDLMILDEFQRFSHLLDGESEAAELARALFEYPNVRTLLLSATPYKMYTTAQDAGGDDHYRDFVRMVQFLEGRDADSGDLDALLKRYRRSLLELRDPKQRAALADVRHELETRLRRVMVRTERLAATPDRNGMLTEVPSKGAELTADDALGYLGLQQVARQCEHQDTLEYWKSAPYVLSFMEKDGYKLNRDLRAQSEDVSSRLELAKALNAPGNLLLPWDQIERYGPVDPGNARMRALMDQTVGQGAHKLLWLAPSLPYYRMRGPWKEAGARALTKRLVFTSWKFAPRAVAGMLSYEAERRMHGREEEGGYTSEQRRRRGSLLRFGIADRRPTGMPVLAWLYPSVTLAQACDPLGLAAESFHEGEAGEGFTSVDEVLGGARMQLEFSLRRLPAGESEGRVDERWYWAAPLLLDQLKAPAATERWFGQENLAWLWAGSVDGDEGDDDAWWAHVETARKLLADGGASLGRRPDDLLEVLAELAVGAPGVLVLRSMLRLLGLRTDPLSDEAGVQIRNAAGSAAWAFRSLFNQPEISELIHQESRGRELPYWRQVVQYSIDGCLQAVLDEYTHVLRDHLGIGTGSAAERVHQIAEALADALSLRTASLTTYDVVPSEGGRTVRPRSRRMRCHFALRFGDERTEDGQVASRADSVRKAFNSPFWPFVLTTTSVGQEGLDFHTYCHAVVHWNLPSNPVDLEQREGRVHRFKGHAVRRNIARTHGLEALKDTSTDLWETMFEKARRTRPEGSTDIVPYWVYPTEGGAKIERHVLAPPLSREFDRMLRLSKSLAIYRMVFGQPRQEDLLRHLRQTVGDAELDGILDELRIDLGPAGVSDAAPIGRARIPGELNTDSG